MCYSKKGDLLFVTAMDDNHEFSAIDVKSGKIIASEKVKNCKIYNKIGDSWGLQCHLMRILQKGNSLAELPARNTICASLVSAKAH